MESDDSDNSSLNGDKEYIPPKEDAERRSSIMKLKRFLQVLFLASSHECGNKTKSEETRKIAA